ncbi:MAG: hypothetical protein KDD35_07245, partial [Bdellovibrionales bacterium]|nr:hypothetical protein [Bdellovibrionales bacterium]
MSSVAGSGDSNRQDEIVRRNREEYLERESQAMRKHNKEIRRLNEAHQAEVDRIKDTFNQQIQEMKERSQQTMTSRDLRHQKETEELRDLYKKQMQAQVESVNSQMEAL